MISNSPCTHHLTRQLVLHLGHVSGPEEELAQNTFFRRTLLQTYHMMLSLTSLWQAPSHLTKSSAHETRECPLLTGRQCTNQKLGICYLKKLGRLDWGRKFLFSATVLTQTIAWQFKDVILLGSTWDLVGKFVRRAFWEKGSVPKATCPVYWNSDLMEC